jgi:predicted nucleic acid-binding protein
MADPYVLVDTSAFINLTRSRSRAAVLRPYVEASRVVLSFVSVAELRRGARRRGYNQDSWRRMELEITGAVVVPPTDDLSNEWARLSDDARQQGHPLGGKAHAHDGWIAATARLYDLPLLTEDGDFEGFGGLRLLPPRPSD